jgi:AcrR family transcriptional regulator
MESSRDRLVNAALGVLVAEGAGRVTARRVAADAGLSPMAMYRHFASMDDLLDVLADVAFERLAEQWRAVGTGTDVDTTLRRQLDLFVDLAVRQPHLYDFLFLLPRRRGRRYPRDFRDRDSPTFTLVYDAVSSGPIASGVTDDDVWEVVFSAVAQVQGLIQLLRGGRIELPDPEFRALCHRAVLRIVHVLYA